jgi:hypothetical protein
MTPSDSSMTCADLLGITIPDITTVIDTGKEKMMRCVFDLDF